MRFSDLFGPTAAELALTALLTASIPTTRAVDFNPVPPPNLDLSDLGRVALTGDFDSISLYTYEGQNQNGFSTNGSQSLLQQLPNGVFTTLQSSDAMIMDMCPFVRRDGSFAGVVVGGNFTSIGGVPAQGAALLDFKKNTVVPLTGLNGSVNAVFCDKERDTVVVGGDFVGLNSTNAISWVGMDGWTNLPFAGFNGPVTTITKNSQGKIVFGGSFSGLGNTTTPSKDDMQIVNLQTANISSSPSSEENGFGDPKNVVCNTGSQDGPGKTWLTADGGGGFWRADFNFGFEPTKLRIRNTHQDGRGTKLFRFTAFPLNGIMNLTYTDPETNQNVTCDNSCPLSDDKDIEFQDFTFVNTVGMNSFQIDIREWYGEGGGFNGIELFQNDIYTYAVSDLNEPSCANLDFASNATHTGPWSVTPSGNSAAEYLTANLADANAANASSTEVTFLPDIRQSGNYTVTIYTPGCVADATCESRGRANVTGFFVAGAEGVNNIISQTNDFDKYDQLYSGPVDLSGSDFRPKITLSAEGDTSLVVALRVRLVLLDPSSSGLNGLFEFDPDKATVDSDFTNNTVATAGTSLNLGADVMSLAVVGETTYVGGNLSNQDVSNFFALPDNGNVTAVTGKGLNFAVATLFPYGNQLYVGGNFTDTISPSTPNIKHVAMYDVDNKKWSSLGGGVNGPVVNIVPLMLNITSGSPETCITINGPFTQVLQSGTKPSFNVSGFAIWVPSRNDWLPNLNIQAQSIRGQLTAATNITDDTPLLAGTIQSQGWALSDAVALSTSNGNANLAPIGFQEPLTVPGSDGPSKLRKRAIATTSAGQNITGAITGLFVTDESRNITILAGRFEALASDNSDIFNVAFIDTAKDGQQTVTGLADGIDEYSAIGAVSRNGNIVSFGGNLTGKVGDENVAGIVLWDLGSSDFVTNQPPGLEGDADVTVHSISNKPGSNDLYVGGSFTSGGETQCPALCVWSDDSWSRPGQGIDGTVSTMLWQGSDKLLVAGNMTISDNKTFLGLYEVNNNQAWTIPEGASAVPGPVTALVQSRDDGSQYWISGNEANGSAYLIKYNGDEFQIVPNVFGDRTTVRGLSVVKTSKDHAKNDLLDNGFTLMITGTINVPNFGNASAVLFNGTTLTPLILANSGNNQGSLSQIVTEMNQKFNSDAGHMKLGYVVAIALAIALGIMALLVAIGLLVERRRKKAEGYRPAPQNYFEKTANMGRIPPERLFSSLNQPAAAPRV